jgi:hypothetical protein
MVPPAGVAPEASVTGQAVKPVSKSEGLVCKTKGVSGTRLKVRKVCGTQQEWDRASNAAKDAVNEVQNGARGACNPGTPCGGT